MAQCLLHFSLYSVTMGLQHAGGSLLHDNSKGSDDVTLYDVDIPGLMREDVPELVREHCEILLGRG